MHIYQIFNLINLIFSKIVFSKYYFLQTYLPKRFDSFAIYFDVIETKFACFWSFEGNPLQQTCFVCIFCWTRAQTWCYKLIKCRVSSITYSAYFINVFCVFSERYWCRKRCISVVQRITFINWVRWRVHCGLMIFASCTVQQSIGCLLAFKKYKGKINICFNWRSWMTTLCFYACITFNVMYCYNFYFYILLLLPCIATLTNKR